MHFNTIVQAAELIRSKQISPSDLTQMQLERIQQWDPHLKSYATLMAEQAVETARQAEIDIVAGDYRGPLHGVPVAVKDLCYTRGVRTMGGAQVNTDHIPAYDATVVRKLTAAGAVLLGKANLSEWANFRSTRSSSGWSGRGGQCRNPYVLDRNPCGSSSGSGVAVSANLAAVAIGTETDGSIVCPSTANGIVGIKPTVGLVSRAGVIPISHTQDTAGPMARTVRDAAIVLGVLAGTDPNDPATADSDTRGLVDYTPFLDADGLRGMRVGVARRFLGFHEVVDQVVESAIAAMESAGAVIVVVATGLFTISMIFGSARGMVHGVARHRRVRRTVERQHLLRALFEWNEEHAVLGEPATDAVHHTAR